MLFSKRKTTPETQTNDHLISGKCRRALLPIMISAALVTSVAHAQEKKPATISLDDVAFSLNGKDYTNRDLAEASINFAPELQSTPAENRRQTLIDIIINTELVAQESEKNKLDEDETFKRLLTHLKKAALRDFYLKKVIRPTINEEQAQERYVELLAKFKPQAQVRARHILVESKEAAAAVIAELDDGKDFAELAKAKSTGPSAPNGGDLGFFNAGEMVEPFKSATKDLKVGEYSKKAVQSQFGWHVLKMEEIKQSKAPTYEQSAGQIKQQLLNELYGKKLTELRDKAKINIVEVPKAEKSKN